MLSIRRDQNLVLCSSSVGLVVGGVPSPEKTHSPWISSHFLPSGACDERSEEQGKARSEATGKRLLSCCDMQYKVVASLLAWPHFSPGSLVLHCVVGEVDRHRVGRWGRNALDLRCYRPLGRRLLLR